MLALKAGAFYLAKGEALAGEGVAQIGLTLPNGERVDDGFQTDVFGLRPGEVVDGELVREGLPSIVDRIAQDIVDELNTYPAEFWYWIDDCLGDFVNAMIRMRTFEAAWTKQPEFNGYFFLPPYSPLQGSHAPAQKGRRS